MSSKRNHCLKHHGRFRQPEAPGIPSSPEPPSPNLSDRQGTLPPPHTPELPSYLGRFPSLSHPYPTTSTVPDHWHPPTQQPPLPNVFPSNQTYLPHETPYTPVNATQYGINTGGVSEARPPLPVTPLPYTPVNATQYGINTGGVSEERPPPPVTPLPVFPPDPGVHSRIHWADGGSDYSESHKSSHHKHSRAPSASSYSEISQPTSADGSSDYSGYEEHADAQNFVDDQGTSLEILAKYRPCTSCRVGTSPVAIEEPSAPSPVPSTHCAYHLDLPRHDIHIQPPSNLDLPRHDMHIQPPSNLDHPRHDIHIQPPSNVSVGQFSKVQNVQERQATPPLVVRFEAMKKPCRSSSCENRRAEPAPSSTWVLLKKFRRRPPVKSEPDEIVPDEIVQEESPPSQSLPVKIIKQPLQLTPRFCAGLHFAYIVLLAAAASLCLRAHEPVATDSDLQVTTTPAPVQETSAPEEPVQRLGIRLPDHWVAIKVPDDEHEEEFLRKFFLSDRDREKPSQRRKRPGEELPSRNRTGSRGRSRHHHRHHSIRPTMSAEQEALNGVTEGHRHQGKEKGSVANKDLVTSSTSNSKWKDEQFIQRLKNHLETTRRATPKKPSLHHTTTPLPLEVQVSTTVSNVQTSKNEEENAVISTEKSHTTRRIPPHPVIPYKLKKKIHLTRPTKDKSPSISSVEDLPGNVLHTNRKPYAKDKAVLRFPESDIAPWNITEWKWNYDNFYHIGKTPQQMNNRLGREKPETVINPKSNEMKALPAPQVIEVPPEFNSKPVSETGSNAEFILLNLLFFTLTGSATLFLWDLHGRLTEHPLCVIPFLLFNIIWFAGVAITFAIFGSVFLAISVLLFILVLLHILEVLAWLSSRVKKRRPREKGKKNAVTFDTASDD